MKTIIVLDFLNTLVKPFIWYGQDISGKFHTLYCGNHAVSLKIHPNLKEYCYCVCNNEEWLYKIVK